MRVPNLLSFRFFPSILVSLVVSALCFLLQTSSNLAALAIKTPVSFQKISLGQWFAPAVELPAGSYFLTAGRPSAPCDLFADGKIISSTRGELPEYSDGLLLGATVVVKAGSLSPKFLIECNNQKGFPTVLTHVPVLAPRMAGVILHMLRAFTDLVMGPASAILLLFITGFTFRGKAFAGDGRTQSALLLFAVVAIPYSWSLAHFTRLFLDAQNASWIHTVLRNLTGLAFYHLCAMACRKRTLVYLSTFTSIVVFLILVAMNPESLCAFDDWMVGLTALVAFVAAFDLFRMRPTTEYAVLFRYAAVTSFAGQLLGIGLIFFNFGFYPSSSVLFLTTTIAAIVALRERLLDRRSEQINIQVVQAITEIAPLEKKLSSISAIIKNGTHYARWSLYADAFAIGVHDRPLERLVRIAEFGYDENTYAEKRVDLLADEGTRMRVALSDSRIVFGRGEKDHANYAILPVSRFACINLSDDVQKLGIAELNDMRLLSRVFPLLETLHDPLAQQSAKLRFELESLRTIRGDGSVRERVGVVFIDINGYSDQLRDHDDPYATFVTKIYLPALCQRVRAWAVKDRNAGDDILFLCIQDLMQATCTVEEASYNVVENLLKFTRIDGAELCRQQGFEPISVQTGVFCGDANIICDDFGVRVTGNVMVEAKRLQQVAPQGSTFVHHGTLAMWPSDGALFFGAKVSELKKTTRLSGQVVKLRDAVAKVA